MSDILPQDYKPHEYKPSMLDHLKHAADAVRKSPSMLRKKFTHKKQMGENSEYSALKNCQENGWLHTDEAIALGIDYHLKYLGSISVFYDPLSSQKNYEYAKKGMEQVFEAKKGHGETHLLNISAARVEMRSMDGKTLVLRHSTSRIAYSTVDLDRPELFCYVALVKNSTLAAAHVFLCKNKKEGYNLTFTCAQAFDMNFRKWKDSKKEGVSDQTQKRESYDIDPKNEFTQYKPAPSSPSTQRAHPPPPPSHPSTNPSEPAHTHPPSRLAHEEHVSDTVSTSSQKTSDSATTEKLSSTNPFSPDFQEPTVQHEEDKDEIDAYFTALSQARSIPNLLDIGLHPEDYPADDTESSQ